MMKKYGSIVMILVAIVILVGGGWYLMKTMSDTVEVGQVGENTEVGDALLERFEKVGKMSETAEKLELKPVAGKTGSGIATREIVGGKLVHTVMADLPELEKGTFYEGWIVGDTVVSTGKMVETKGGWVLEYTGDASLINHDRVVITLETKDDKKPEVHVLEGVFK